MAMFKIRLPGECFWVSGVKRLTEGLFTGRVENNLTDHPYRIGDRIEFSEEHWTGWAIDDDGGPYRPAAPQPKELV